jgi:predicted ribosomally synthesized peptide with nif11-like leader
LAFHQQATNQLGGDQLGRAGEEATGEGWEILDGRGCYGEWLLLPGSHAILLTPERGWAKLEFITPQYLKPMSEEQLKAFLEAVKADAGLQEKLKAAKDVDAVVEIAKAAGFVISAEELKKAQAEISEEELEGVAGGTACIYNYPDTRRVNKPSL